MIASLRESQLDRVPSAYDDPISHVLAIAPNFAPSDALIQAVTQNVLRALLVGFLHEPPLAHWYRNAFCVGGETLAFHEVLARLLPRLNGTTAAECAMFARAPLAQDFAEWVSALYRLGRRLLPPAESRELEAPTPQVHLSRPLPLAVRRLTREMHGHRGLRLYLHGSLATCDATAYSDVDTLLIVSHEWLESAERANELRRIVLHAEKCLYAYDPLQHHGFMLATELDLSRYARCYYPLELLSHAYVLSGSPDVRYRVRPSDEEHVSLLRKICTRLEKLERGEIPAPATRFALKAMLSEMMLLPTYFLQATHRVLYKRESFRAVEPLLSAPAREAMSALSAWRLGWKRKWWERSYRALGAGVPVYLQVRILARARGERVSKHDVDRWRSILPGVRLMAADLLRQVSVQ